MAVATKQYRDLDLNFEPHVNTRTLSVLEGDKAIVRSLRNLLLTKHGEKPFLPDFGSKIKSLLFEPADPFLADSIKDEIERVVKNYEPRVNLKRVDVRIDPDQNGFYTTLVFFVRNEAREKVVQLFLERTR